MNQQLFDLAHQELQGDAARLLQERLLHSDALHSEFATIRTQVEQLRQLAQEPIDLPPGLAAAALEFTAADLVAHREYTTEQGFIGLQPVVYANNRPRLADWSMTRQHINAAVLCTVVLLCSFMGLAAVQKARIQAEIANCQNHLRDVHTALVGYSDQNQGHFPKTGSQSSPLAGDFLQELERMGQPVDSAARWCPSLGSKAMPVGYAYTLGYRDHTGAVQGLQRPHSASDDTPIVADLPLNDSHPHKGWNILTVGGSVRFTRVTRLGTDGDELFTNANGEHRAGLFAGDVSLGSPYDRP